MGIDRVAHGAIHDQANDYANPKTHVMQRLDALTHCRDALAHIERLGEAVFRECKNDESQQAA